MTSSLIRYDKIRDIDSKKPFPVIMFGENVEYIELGQYVRWANLMEDKGFFAAPLGPYINKNIAKLRGSSYSTKEEFDNEFPIFKEIYGISFHDYIVSIITQ